MNTPFTLWIMNANRAKSTKNLQGANLQGANLNWQSHEALSAVLFSSGERELAGLVLVSVDWCWKEFLDYFSPEQLDTVKVIAAKFPNTPENLK